MKSLRCSLLLLASIAATTAAFPSSLVHRYSFNDGNANDSVGHADGKVIGPVAIANGSAQFSGKKGTRIELPAAGDTGLNLNKLSAVTIEAWYTVDKVAIFQRIFDFGSATNLDGAGKGSNYLFFCPTSYFKDSRAAIHSTASKQPGNSETGPLEAVAKGKPTAPARETHVAVTVDATNLTLFIDGVQVSQQPLGDRALANVSGDFALLGASLYGFGPYDPVLSGSINEVRIYDAALTADQVSASFKAGPDKLAE